MSSADSLRLERYKKLAKNEEVKNAWRGRVIKIIETDYLSDKFKLEFDELIDNVKMTPPRKGFKSAIVASVIVAIYFSGFVYMKGAPAFMVVGTGLIPFAFLLATYLSYNDSIEISTEGITLNGKLYSWEDDIAGTAILLSIGNNYTKYKLLLLLNNDQYLLYDINHFCISVNFTHEISAYIQYFREQHIIQSR